MNVILYTTHCPKCNVLHAKLEEKNIEFTENEDVKALIKKGYMTAPMLEVDGDLMEFGEAVKWVNEQ